MRFSFFVVVCFLLNKENTPVYKTNFTFKIAHYIRIYIADVFILVKVHLQCSAISFLKVIRKKYMPAPHTPKLNQLIIILRLKFHT